MHRFNTIPRRFRGQVSDQAPIVSLCINLVRHIPKHTDDIYWSAEGSIMLTAKGPRMDGWFLLPLWRTASYLLAPGKMEIKNHCRLRIFSWYIRISKMFKSAKDSKPTETKWRHFFVMVVMSTFIFAAIFTMRPTLVIHPIVAMGVLNRPQFIRTTLIRTQQLQRITGEGK